MVLEKLLELLVGLVLAATAGTGGITTAQNATSHASPPAPVSVTEKIELGMAHAQGVQASDNAANPSASAAASDGLTTATSAIEHAMDLAPDAADGGLQRALDAVSSAGTAASEPHIPVDVPAGRP
jgi:hypothetical protein